MSSGARLMAEDGVMDDIDFIVACHMDNNYDVGLPLFVQDMQWLRIRLLQLSCLAEAVMQQPHTAVDTIAMGLKFIRIFSLC